MKPLDNEIFFKSNKNKMYKSLIAQYFWITDQIEKPISKAINKLFREMIILARSNR